MPIAVVRVVYDYADYCESVDQFECATIAAARETVRRRNKENFRERLSLIAFDGKQINMVRAKLLPVQK